jgi:NAD+ synthase
MQELTKRVIQWTKEYFEQNNNGYAIIGISGGKDSTIAAAVLKEAIGSNKIIAVMMPNGKQKDINDSYAVCDFLCIPEQNRYTVNIKSAFIELLGGISGGCNIEDSSWSQWANNDNINTNLPARLRMCTLYTIAATYHDARVVNTSNRSERYIGYSTKFGDGVGDFSVFGNLTVREVLSIGDDLGLPYELVHKAPSDGMSGKSDEEKIGFTYEELDNYLLETSEISDETLLKIERLHQVNRHKLLCMPMFNPWCDEEEIADEN